MKIFISMLALVLCVTSIDAAPLLSLRVRVAPARIRVAPVRRVAPIRVAPLRARVQVQNYGVQRVRFESLNYVPTQRIVAQDYVQAIRVQDYGAVRDYVPTQRIVVQRVVAQDYVPTQRVVAQDYVPPQQLQQEQTDCYQNQVQRVVGPTCK